MRTVEGVVTCGEAMKREIIRYTVQKARNTGRISIAAPGDFVLRKTATAIPPCALPYCLDVIRRRALYVCDAEIRAVQDAPFYYLALRRTAREVLSVPIEDGPLFAAQPEPDPVFLFSPGRVGSTLISRVLADAGVPSLSEPDFYTQAASLPFCSPLNPWRRSFQKAMWAMSADLSAALGAQPVIKLRAECARRPELFVRAPQAKTIVLFRGFENWSRSTAQAFGAGPSKAVAKYWDALACFEVLNRISQCHLMRYEDWVNDPQAAAAALGRFLGVAIDPASVARTLQSHSQDGTPLQARILPHWQEKWRGAMALWHSPRLQLARARLTIPPVWD